LTLPSSKNSGKPCAKPGDETVDVQPTSADAGANAPGTRVVASSAVMAAPAIQATAVPTLHTILATRADGRQL